MRLVWTRAALDDRTRIYDWIEVDNPQAALALDELFVTRTSRLPLLPLIGRPGRVAGTRELVVTPNFVAVYDVLPETIRILRILHAAQLWPPEQKDTTKNSEN